MTPATAWTDWTACTSALRLDRWLSGELAPEDARAVSRHLLGCEACATAADALRRERAERLPPLRALAGVPAAPAPPATGRPAPSRRGRLLALAAGAAALAAGLVVALRPAVAPGPATALKGAGLRVAMYVQHAGEVRRAAEGEAVAPGDAVRFAVTTPVRAYVAVLSLDPRGRASVYFPTGPRAEAVSAGVDAPLPAGTRLDESIGEERIWGLFCAEAIELEPVRARLERAGNLDAVPDGCGVSAWRFVKR